MSYPLNERQLGYRMGFEPILRAPQTRVLTFTLTIPLFGADNGT